MYGKPMQLIVKG